MIGAGPGSIEAAERAVLAAPRSPDAWLALVAAHQAAGQTESALAACDGGLSFVPHAAALLIAKGQILRDLGDAPASASAFRQALALAPQEAAAAFGLALLALDAGDWDGAEGLIRGEGPRALWIAGRVALGRGDFEGARAAFEPLLAWPGLADAQRAEAALRLSEALDGLGASAEAFRAAAAGKAIQRRLHANQAATREPIVERLRRLEAWFTHADPADWRPAGGAFASPAAGHVFLIGFPRSGTTLLEQALAGHPQVRALEEAPTLAAAHDAFLASDDGLAHLANLSETEADRWRARYWAVVAAHGVEVRGRLFLDKAPAGTEDLPLVARLFPDAKVLFAIRDPRDVVLSCLRQDFRMNAMTYAFTDLAETAACYDANFRLADTYWRILPLPWLDVRHESLLTDFPGGLAQICRFLGLAYDPAMADVATTARGRAVRTPSAPQVRAGVSVAGLGRWRRYAAELAPILPQLQPWADRFGYDR